MAGDATIALVTAPLDGSVLAEAALPIAAGIANALSVPLTLLRVIPSPVFTAGDGFGYESYYPISEAMERDEEAAVAAYLVRVAASLRGAGLAVETRWERSATQRAEYVIGEYLAERPTGIAVMASHGRGGVLRWALGSTAEGVLDRAPCPILIVRAGVTTGASREIVPVYVAPSAG